MSEKTYLQALNEALKLEMERDENIFILGEDVGQFGGCFGVTQDFSTSSAKTGSRTPPSPRAPSWARPPGPPPRACAPWPS